MSSLVEKNVCVQVHVTNRSYDIEGRFYCRFYSMTEWNGLAHYSEQIAYTTLNTLRTLLWTHCVHYSEHIAYTTIAKILSEILSVFSNLLPIYEQIASCTITEQKFVICGNVLQRWSNALK